MITELASQDKVIGVKQSRKAIREGRAKRVYLACDADPAIIEPVAASCAAAGIPVGLFMVGLCLLGLALGVALITAAVWLVAWLLPACWRLAKRAWRALTGKKEARA